MVKKSFLAKTLLALSVVLLLMSSSGEPAAAEVGIDLQYWYCDSNIGLVWPISDIPTYLLSNSYVPLPNLSVSNLNTYVDTAYNRWAAALNGKTWSIGPSPGPGPGPVPMPMASSPCMQIQPKTVTELQVPDSYDGLTVLPYSSVNFLIHGYYGRQTIDIYQVIGPVYIHPIYNSRSGRYSINKWKIIMTHEMGHAFGYWGHYSSGAVMKQGATTTYPNLNEIKHLRQLN